MRRESAIKILLVLIAIIMIFHLCILVKLIPYNIAWGGRLSNDSEMYVFEVSSLAINLFLVVALLFSGGYIRSVVSPKIVNAILWFYLFLFVLNTVGNLFAKTNFEKSFAGITLALAALIGVVLKTGRQNDKTH